LLKILLTGSSGQLAGEFISFFQKNGVDFFAPKECDFNIADKNAVSEIFSYYKPTHLINCAAYNAVDDAQSFPQKAFAINRDAVETLALECAKHFAVLVHFGTDYVFDGVKTDFYLESDAPNPLNVYGQSKLEGEEKAGLAKKSLILRLSWVIGGGKQNFLYKLSQWAASGSPLKISADEVSVPTFAFDITRACFKAVKDGVCGLYHLTNSGYASRYELAKKYCSLKKYKNTIIPVPLSDFTSKAKRPVFSPMSNALICKTLQISVPHWEESLEKYCKYHGN
jgi:dTDP-4-dehydrorhamnose reductase